MTKDKDSRIISSSSTIRSCSGVRILPCVQRQDDAEGRSLSPLTLHGDITPETLHDPIAHPQAEPGPFADALRREKRGEDLLHMLRCDATTVVRDPHSDLTVVLINPR